MLLIFLFEKSRTYMRWFSEGHGCLWPKTANKKIRILSNLELNKTKTKTQNEDEYLWVRYIAKPGSCNDGVRATKFVLIRGLRKKCCQNGWVYQNFIYPITHLRQCYKKLGLNVKVFLFYARVKKRRLTIIEKKLVHRFNDIQSELEDELQSLKLIYIVNFGKKIHPLLNLFNNVTKLQTWKLDWFNLNVALRIFFTISLLQ